MLCHWVKFIHFEGQKYSPITQHNSPEHLIFSSTAVRTSNLAWLTCCINYRNELISIYLFMICPEMLFVAQAIEQGTTQQWVNNLIVCETNWSHQI